MRLLLAVVAGVVIANVVFLLVGFVGDALYPTPPELLDPQTPEETAARVEGRRRVDWLWSWWVACLEGSLGEWSQGWSHGGGPSQWRLSSGAALAVGCVFLLSLLPRAALVSHRTGRLFSAVLCSWRSGSGPLSVCWCRLQIGPRIR